MPEGIGVVDLMIGFPQRDRRRSTTTCGRLRRTTSRRTWTFPAEYMFKDVPDDVDEGVDPVDVTLGEMDRYGIETGLVGVSRATTAEAARAAPRPLLRLARGRPERRAWRRSADPRGRTRSSASRRSTLFPAGLHPAGADQRQALLPDLRQVRRARHPDRASTPASPGRGCPSACQHVERFDEVCYDFPELAHRDAPRRRAVGGRWP